MVSRDTVTWLLPVLNGAKYLEECLGSIEKQTYPHFEVIAWDNGSSDGSQEILNTWVPERLPGRVITDRPLTLGASLAALVETAPTALCARIDADDVCEPNRLESQVAFLDSQKDVVAVGTQVRRLDPDGTLRGIYHPLPLSHESIILRLLRRWSLWHPTVLYRREAVLAAGNYENESPGQDYGLWLRLACVGRLANLPQPLLRYRVHTQSVTSKFISDASMGGHVRRQVLANGPALYGCEEDELEALIDRRLPMAFWALSKLIYSTLKRRNISKAAFITNPLLRQECSTLSRHVLSACSRRLMRSTSL